MILANPRDLALSIGASAVAKDGVGDESLLIALHTLKSEIEGAMNVGTLDLGDFEDEFDLPYKSKPSNYELRLRNGYLTAAEVTATVVEDSSALEVVSVDREMGIVTVVCPPVTPTKVLVAYSSGFDIPEDVDTNDDVHVDPKFRVGVGLPPYLFGVCALCYTHWRRNALASPAVGKEYGFLPTLNDATSKLIKGAIYKHYMRPRNGTVFCSNHRAV